MDWPDFGFLEFFESDDYKIYALVIICGTVFSTFLIRSILTFIKEDRADKRKYDIEKLKLQSKVSSRKIESLGEELNLND